MSFYALSELTSRSRSSGSPFSFTGSKSRSWDTFVRDCAALREYIQSQQNDRWIITTENSYFFSCALFAVMQSGKPSLLSANTSPSFLSEIAGNTTGIFSDHELPGASVIPDLLSGNHSGTTDFPPIQSEMCEIVLYTSGSTGKPKAFAKRLTELETETTELYRLWGDRLKGKRVYSTVNHQHIYGLLFSILLPVSAGLPFCEDQIKYPESLESIPDPDPVLVCSPAFFKRLAETPLAPGRFREELVVFSSGGVLPVETARAAGVILGTTPLEIYGSTETGGIAWRKSVEETAWKPFPRNTVTLNDEGRICVRSPYIHDPEGFTSGDIGRFNEDGTFMLEGRADSIVKIEEKRISLTEVENRLLESPYVRETSVIALKGKRQYLGAVVVLSEEGKRFFQNREKKEVNGFFMTHLARYLENTVIPKKWRFIDALPRNTQDKISRETIERLFRKPEELTIHDTEVSGTHAALTISFGRGSVYFDGHFPEFLILPGVTQVDLAMRQAHELLGTTLAMRTITRIKFKRPILPEQKMRLELTYTEEKNKLTFSYRTYPDGVLCSEGTVILENT